MNLVAWAGYWFYDATNNVEMAALFASYGLLTSAPEYEPPAGGGWSSKIFDWILWLF